MEGENFSDPPIFHVYTKEVNRLQPSDRSVVGVLYACVKAVVATAPAPAVPESGDEYPEVPSNDEYCDPSGSFVKLSDISSRDTLKALTHSVDILSKIVSLSPYTLEMNDSVRRQRLKKLLLPQTAIPSSSRAPYREDMTNFEISARIRLQFYRLLSENGLPLRPLMSQVEQGIKESELLTFSSLAPSDLYRSNQLQEFADMVLKETKALPNFTGALQMGDGEDGSMTRRKYFRFCSALLFAQILSEEHVTEPLVLKRYYPMTDDLLYCLHWPPPDRRNKKDLWNYTLRQLVSRATSKKQSKRGKKVEPVEGDTELVTETTDVSTETVTLTPAGKMILMVKKHGMDAANPYVTAFLHGTTFGVRMVPLDEHRSVDEDEEIDDSEPISAAAAVGAATTAAAPAAPAATAPGTEESTGDQNTSSTELNATSLNLLKCGFFYHTTDDVRYHVFDGPSHDPVVKPDKFGTVCVSARFPQRLQVTVCSNGSIQVLSDASVMKEDKVTPTEAEYPLFYEKSRLVGEKGTVYRRFDGRTHPIVAEYLFSDGSRELHLSTDLLQRYRNRSPRKAVAQSTMDDIFEFSLLKLVPLETRIIRLGANGDVVCFGAQEKPASGSSATEDQHVSAVPSTTDLNLEKATHAAPPSSSSSSNGSHPVEYERLRVNISNIMTSTIDAETKSRVYYYRDGRLLVMYPDESTRVQFPDRTVIQFHPKNSMVYISRFRAWPTIEIDVEVDSMCRGHAQGLEVPINKGGERVRSRVTLPDGSILLVKYDTRVTASSNGSIRLVCRDRTQVLVQDNGQLCFRPFTTWNKEAQQSFDKDLMIEDVVPEVVSHTGLTIAHFTPLADMDHPLQDTSLNGGSSTTTLPTETSSKVKEDASRVSYQGKQTAAALKAKQKRQDSMNTIKTVPSGATLPSTAAGANKGIATKHLKKDKSVAQDATAVKAPEDMDHHELFTSSAEADAVVTVHLRESRLHVLDYEFNAFDMDLTPGRRALLLQRQQEATMTPAEKKRASSARAQREDNSNNETSDPASAPSPSFTYNVRLAGEVEGLKPPAVARIPKSPRCFIINRFGDATEVLSLQDVSVWECYFKNIGDAYRVEAPVTLPPAELGPCRVLRYFVPKRLVSSYLDGFRFDEIVGKRQYCSAVIPAAAQFYLEHQSATLHHVNEEEWLVHHLPRIFEALSLTERPPLSNEGYNRITQAIQRCEEFRQERIKNIDRFAIEDPRTQEQIDEEEMMVKRLKQLYKAAKAVAGKKKEHRSDPMKIEEGDEGEEDEESVADKRKGPGSLASSPSKVNSARSRGTGSNAGAGVIKGKQHTILEAQNEDEDAEEGEEDEPDFGSEDEKEPDPVEMLIKNTFEDFLSDAYPNGGYNSELLPVSYLQDAFIQMFNRFISPELIEQASYDCGEVDPGLEELTMNEFRAVYFSLDRIINGRTDTNADRNNAGYDNDFSHSQDSYDEDEFDESASRHRSRPTTTASNNLAYEEEDATRSRTGRNTASAPPLNFNKLHQNGTPQSSVLGDGSKDPTKWDDGGSLGMGSATYSEASPRAGTFAAGSGLRMVRNVKSANP